MSRIQGGGENTLAGVAYPQPSFKFDFCFTALQHILGHFGRGQLT